MLVIMVMLMVVVMDYRKQLGWKAVEPMVAQGQVAGAGSVTLQLHKLRYGIAYV